MVWDAKNVYFSHCCMRKDVQTVRAGGAAARGKRKSGCKNSNHSKILLNGTESSTNAAGQENVNENSHQGCEVLDFMDLPTSSTSTTHKDFFSCLLPNLLHLIFQVFSNHKCWWWEQPLASFWSTWIPEKSSAPFHLIIYTPMFKARTSWVPWCQHYCWAKVKPPRASMFWHNVWRMKERHFSLWNSRAQ